MGKIGESMLFVAMGIAIVGLFLFFPTLKTTGNVVLSKLQGGLGLTTGYIFIAIAILLAIFIIKRNVRR